MSHHRIKPKSDDISLRKDWRVFWPVLAVLAVPLLITVLVMVATFWAGHPQKLAANRDLQLDIAKLRVNQLHLFETSVSGEKVRFVVERTQDNTVHVAMAACKFCYRERHSNRVQDGVVLCARCNGSMNFESTKARGRANSCDLSEIPHQQTPQTLTVLTRDIAQTVTKLARQ
ncbi:MAG: Fe-S-containing protein [Acidobacteriaceae bacterium]